MDLGRTTTSTEAIALIGMVYYYRDMCHRRYHILAPMAEVAAGLKGRNYFAITHSKITLSNSRVWPPQRIY